MNNLVQTIREFLNRGDQMGAIRQYNMYQTANGGMSNMVAAREEIVKMINNPQYAPSFLTMFNTQAKASQILAQIRNLINSKEKIAAIKLFREYTGFGLVDSKYAVEAMQADKNFIPLPLANGKKTLASRYLAAPPLMGTVTSQAGAIPRKGIQGIVVSKRKKPRLRHRAGPKKKK